MKFWKVSAYGHLARSFAAPALAGGTPAVPVARLSLDHRDRLRVFLDTPAIGRAGRSNAREVAIGAQIGELGGPPDRVGGRAPHEVGIILALPLGDRVEPG